MGRLPSGTVTFLFTDIEGSTQLWEKYPEAMNEALAKHDWILRDVIESNNGYVIKTTGDGFHGVFEKAIVAVNATLQAQRNFKAPICDLQINVRMGDLDTAHSKFLQSADLAKKLGNKRQMYSCYSELAHVLRGNGELDEPLEIYRDLLPKWKDLGHRAAVAHELECIAYLLARKGNLQRAATILGAAGALRNLIDSTPTLLE